MTYSKSLLLIAFFAQIFMGTAQDLDSLSTEKPMDSLTLEIDTSDADKMFDSLILSLANFQSS